MPWTMCDGIHCSDIGEGADQDQTRAGVAMLLEFCILVVGRPVLNDDCSDCEVLRP